jgi:hypothetical protein
MKAPTLEQVDAAMRYVESHLDIKKHRELFKSDHGRPSKGARQMGVTEFETLPHRAMIVLAGQLKEWEKLLERCSEAVDSDRHRDLWNELQVAYLTLPK